MFLRNSLENGGSYRASVYPEPQKRVGSGLRNLGSHLSIS
jgi:hypothetical protein